MQRVGAKFAAGSQPPAGVLALRGLRWSPGIVLLPRSHHVRVTAPGTAAGPTTSMCGAAHKGAVPSPEEILLEVRDEKDRPGSRRGDRNPESQG